MSYLRRGYFIFLSLLVNYSISHAANQTLELSPILSQASLPFEVKIEQIQKQLPVGLHSGAYGIYKGLWVFIGGSTLGLHGFGLDPFPEQGQNTNVYVINSATGSTCSRSLSDPYSELTLQQIDSLSTISPEFYQSNNTLYMTGGYGVDRETASIGTKPILSALYLPGIVEWTCKSSTSKPFAQSLRQLRHPIFQIAGGTMYPLNGISHLVFGQNFTGIYTDSSNGAYSMQIRRFKIVDNGGQLAVTIYESKPAQPNANYRRRDLNILPTMLISNNRLQQGLIALAGVFTTSNGVWTVPVTIDPEGQPFMENPQAATAFKQGMNQYISAAVSLYSKKNQSSYYLLLGGISYEFYDNGVLNEDSQLPFINQITTVRRDKNNHFTQHFMKNQYPVIRSTDVNPGNQLLFGASAYFIPENISKYPNGVFNLDNIRKPTTIGYIVGGIQSTLPNTNTQADSAASRYIFKVVLTPKANG